MAVFRDAQQVYQTLGTLWRHAFADSKIKEKFSGMNTTIHFIVHNPETELWLYPNEIIEGSSDKPPIGSLVEMEMEADTAHKFWLDKLSVPMAVAKREIKAKGPINKVLGFVTLLKPVKKLYPEICQKEGLPTT